MLNYRGQKATHKQGCGRQYKLVGPQRPCTVGELFASLPITRNLVSVTDESRSGLARLGLSARGATRRQQPETNSLVWLSENVCARSPPGIAIPFRFSWAIP